MEAIQDVQRLSGLGRHHFQVGLPHIAAYETQPPHHLRPQRLQPPPQRPLRPPLADPQQAPTVRVDLVDHGQEVARPQAVAPVDLVHAHRLHPLQFAVRQAPLHKPLHRPVHGLPTGLKHLGGLPPTQSPPPARQKAHHRRRQGPLPLAPRHLLHYHPVLGTFHPPGRIEEIDRNPPQRHLLPPPLLQPVIARRWPLTLRAPPPNSLVRLQGNFNPTLRPFSLMEANVLINKSDIRLNPVENCFNFELNGWSPRRGFACCSNHRLTQPTETSYLSLASFGLALPLLLD